MSLFVFVFSFFQNEITNQKALRVNRGNKVTFYQCCGSHIEFGSGSRILAQFESGVMLSILKRKKIVLEENNFSNKKCFKTLRFLPLGSGPTTRLSISAFPVSLQHPLYFVDSQNILKHFSQWQITCMIFLLFLQTKINFSIKIYNLSSHIPI